MCYYNSRKRCEDEGRGALFSFVTSEYRLYAHPPPPQEQILNTPLDLRLYSGYGFDLFRTGFIETTSNKGKPCAVQRNAIGVYIRCTRISEVFQFP